MKTRLAIALLAAFIPSVPLLADPVTVGVNDQGILVDAGSAGQFTLGAPGLLKKEGPNEQPSFAPSGDGGRATYASGVLLDMKVDKATGKITFHYTQGAPSKAFKFNLKIPLKFNQGGTYSFNGAPLKPIPAEQGAQFVESGNANSFRLADPLGNGFAVEMPGGYSGLQDNRIFSSQSYVFICQVDTGGKAEGYFAFSVRTLDAGAAPAAAAAASPSPAVPAGPRVFLVDRFGQSARKDYPGKVKDEQELKDDVEKQKAALPAPGGPPRDVFGGLAGSGVEFHLTKTGFFHVGTAGERQFLVDPDGNAFYQLGVCGIANTDDFTTVRGREKIYEWVPEAGGDFATAWRPGTPGAFSFFIANWIRKFGRPYTFEEWTGQVVERLRAWGFNSAGAFSLQSAKMKELQFPYTGSLPVNGNAIKSLPDRLGASFVMDPFAPGNEEALDKAFTAKVDPFVTDPLLIGYSFGNEQHFENIPKLVPTYKSGVAAKVKLVAMLQAKYGDIGKFNAAWNPATSFASWDDLPDAPLFIRTDAAEVDMRDYLKVYLDTYYEMISRTFRKHDPNHLLLGSRWTPGTAGNELVVRTASKYFDVVTVNYYTYGIESYFLKRVHEWSGDKPIILSEWYYGSSEMGLNGGKEVANQKDRGLAYRNYIEQSASLPFVVGSQWFIYGDQSITGRFFEGFNGEGNNSGLVDVTDRPYADFIPQVKETNDRIYPVMLGREKPFAFDDPRFAAGKPGGSGKVATIPKALPGLELDGTTSHWPGRPAEPLTPKNQVNGPPNPDLRADFRLCWDEKNLYFLAEVKDATPLKNEREAKALYNGDGFELFVGSKSPDQGGSMIFSDRQVLLGAAATPKAWVVDNPELGAAIRMLTVKSVTGDGYTLEAAIPWSVLGVEPKAGTEFLFDIGLDNSDDGLARRHQLMWNGNAKNSSDRGAWGRARIIEN